MGEVFLSISFRSPPSRRQERRTESAPRLPHITDTAVLSTKLLWHAYLSALSSSLVRTGVTTNFGILFASLQVHTHYSYCETDQGCLALKSYQMILTKN